MIQIPVPQDTTSRADSSAMVDASAVLQVKLDSALMAHIQVPAPLEKEVRPARPSPVVPVVLGGVLVGLLLLVRAMARGASFAPAGRREVRPGPEVAPPEVPGIASGPPAPRTPRRPAPPPPITLPPHVAAVVARIEAKKVAPPQGGVDEAPPPPRPRGEGGGGRLDVLIGG